MSLDVYLTEDDAGPGGTDEYCGRQNMIARKAVNAACPDAIFNGPRLVEEIEGAIKQVMRRSPLSEAITLIETRFSTYYFTFGRGRCKETEPLYGFALYPAHLGAAEGRPILEAEHDDPVECVRLALSKFGAQMR